MPLKGFPLVTVDWIEFRKNGLSAFVVTMDYSRASYVEYVDNEQVDTLIACHMNAFGYFGGVPRECLYDNMKTVTIKRNAYGYGKHQFNAQFPRRDLQSYDEFIPLFAYMALPLFTTGSRSDYTTCRPS